MADISVTASSVIGSTDSNNFNTGIAGEAITAGQALALGADSRVVLADANGATNNLKEVIGISLHAAAANQPIRYQNRENITFNAAFVQGVIYVLSATPGGICPSADLDDGHRVVVIGIASSDTVLKVNILNSGVDVPVTP